MNFEEKIFKKIEAPVENIEEINKNLSKEIVLRAENFLKKFSVFVEEAQDELGINLDDLKKEGFLGQGGAGSVFALNKDICFKNMKNRPNDDNFNEYDNEALIARQINGLQTDNVKTPYFFAYYRTEYSRKMLMEKIDGVDLQYVFNGDQYLPNNFYKKYVKGEEFDSESFHDDLWEYIDFMHDKGIVHNDLAPRNIMIDNSGKIVVIDTGRSQILNTKNEGEKKKLLDKDYNDTELITQEFEKYFENKKEIDENPKVNVYQVHPSENEEEIKVEIFNKKTIDFVKRYLDGHEECGLCEVVNGLHISPKKEDLLLGLRSLNHGNHTYYIGFKND